MNSVLRGCIAAGALCSLVACAGVTHVELSDANDACNRGIRYYRNSHYLFVYSNGKGGLITEIKSLPDPNKKMSAKPYSWLSSLQLTLQFTNGVLTNSNETADSTAVPKAVLAAVETIAPLLLAALNEPGAELTLPAPHVYKILVHDNAITFKGGKADADIKVSLLPQTPEKK